jgi:aminopeptidase
MPDPRVTKLAQVLVRYSIGIQHFTKNMLFNEKVGGTIHLAVGAGYPETDSKNESGIHWDMLCDMKASEVTVDGKLFYKDGQFVG